MHYLDRRFENIWLFEGYAHDGYLVLLSYLLEWHCLNS